jgi:ATP/maltotriose-dependent transcriptional regulator MalT
VGRRGVSREREVLAYLPTTSSNRDIAAELGVSTNTIKTHLRGIYRKLQAENRRDAVTRARTCLSLRDEPPGAASRPRDAR